MKTGNKHSKKRQHHQQSGGKAVLVTLYVVRPRRDGGSASSSSSRNFHHRHDVHHHHHHHHHIHGGGNKGSERRGHYDRRADLLEYSRKLRATAATPTPARPPLTPRHDIKTVSPALYGGREPAAAADNLVLEMRRLQRAMSQKLRSTAATPPHPLPPRRDIRKVSPARHDGRQPASDNLRLGIHRLERAMSQQKIRQRCFGDWNWKKVFNLVLPSHVNIGSSKRSRNHRDDSDSKNKSKARPAALLVGKTKVGRSGNNDDKGLMKKLLGMFRQQSRPASR